MTTTSGNSRAASASAKGLVARTLDGPAPGALAARCPPLGKPSCKVAPPPTAPAGEGPAVWRLDGGARDMSISARLKGSIGLREYSPPLSHFVTRPGVAAYRLRRAGWFPQQKRGEPSCRCPAHHAALSELAASAREAFKAPAVSSSISHCRPRGIAPRRNHCQTVPRPTPRARAASLWPPKCCARSFGVITSTTVDNEPAGRQPL